jgi:hypothetical protein
MRKFAIFVEGQTELITVREFLLREFGYAVNIECRTLFKPSEFKKTPYDYPQETCDYYEFHFQIINVGNDHAVLQRILKREKYMWSAGYEKIIGLRDMYSKAYREASPNKIDDAITQKFIEGFRKTIQDRAQSPEKIVMCFAIMEIEAWFLAMYQVFEKLDSRLTIDYIKKQTGIDLKYADPETEFFHPADQMETICRLAGMGYDKHKGDIEAIAAYLEKDDYQNLLESNKCSAFKKFYNLLERQK